MESKDTKEDWQGLAPPELIFLGKVREVIKGQGSSQFDTFTEGCGSPGPLGNRDEPFCTE